MHLKISERLPQIKTLVQVFVYLCLFFTLSPFSTSSYAASYIANVTDVADGDSFDAREDGEAEDVRIRMLGINTNEPGICHATDASDRLKELIELQDVTLSASDLNLTLGFGRPARFVDKGAMDIGKIMLEEGLAIPYPNETDRSRNELYLAVAAVAQQAEIGIWDNTACGDGPSQSIPIELQVSWDAAGDDSENINGEWVDINNLGGSSLSLTGWRLRDPSTRFYEFENGVSVPAEGMLRVYVGEVPEGKAESATEKYWGLTSPIYTNEVGQGTFLLDPDNDIRAEFTYPCQFDCSDALVGVVSLFVNYDAPGLDNDNPNGEWVDVINSSNSPINLYGYFLTSFYHFEKNHILPANGSIRVRVGGGTESATELFAGRPKALFANAGGSIALSRSDNVLIDEYTWPNNDPTPSDPPLPREGPCFPVPVGEDVSAVVCVKS
ncbi:MAG: micrococcal nuclease [Porticoccaceae bacterium]|jgi:micrococcal nuclease